MSDEDIPEAPAFCRRFTPAVANIVTQQTTKEQLMKLGSNISESIKGHNEDLQRSNLTVLNKNMAMGERLNEYFALDPIGQKARMLDLFVELEELKKINQRYSDSIKSISTEYQREKEDREELSDQCDNYIEEIDEKETEIEKKEKEIISQKVIIKMLETSYNKIWKKCVIMGFIFACYVGIHLHFIFQ
jgi:predicted  nucleic acid-binding Zn-ribbon protein